jgi:sugar/nucleoside kinase (ribokinase family)
MNVSGFDVLSIGETMAMLVADAPGSLAQAQHFSKRLAGADTNVAIGLARLGLRVGWISRLGADSFGAFAVGIISARLEGRSWPDALRRANWIASRALQVVGDMEGLPMRHELPATY